jgi:SpoVK/Ycf46/Vps4 family AAA+-type ATPase
MGIVRGAGDWEDCPARAFAQDLNMPIFVFNLAMLSNRTLIKEWKKIRGNVPCIALFEDIDNVFHGRNNVCRKNMGMFPMWEDFDQNNSSPAGSGSNGKDDKKFADMSPLTFDCFINCLDGVDRADGIFVIITTNDISKLDPALGVPKNDGSDDCISTRPGRIDKVIELSYMTEDCKIRMAQRILKGCDLELKDMIYFIRNNPDLKETPAQFQERCAQIAIKWWEKQLALQQPKVQKKEIVVRKPPKSLFEGRVSYKWTLLEKETP